MTTVTTTEQFINFLDEKIKLYEDFRTILYSLIDNVHYSPMNQEIFTLLQQMYVRMDELSQVKTALSSNEK